MNRKILIFGIFLFIAFFSGCGEDEKNGAEPESLRIAKDKVNLDFDEKSNEGVFGVLSNTKWSLTVSDGTWLTCNPTSGEGSINVLVSVNPNTDAEVRSASITVTSQSGNFTHTVTVTQLGTEPSIIVNPTSADVLPTGGEVAVTVTATNTWAVDTPEWVTIMSKESGSAVLEVEPNDTDEGREGIVTFKLNGANRLASLTITQPNIPIIEPVVNYPDEAAVGDNINITGTDLLLVREIWFGEIQGVITEEGRTNESMTVTIPESAATGTVNLKIVFGDKGRNTVVGQISLLSAQPIVNALAERAPIKGIIYLTGSNLDRIEEVWFAGVKGSIVTGGTNVLVKVTIPASATPGPTEVSVTYSGDKSKTIGNVELYCADPDNNLALFAGSLMADVPKVAVSNANSFGAGGGRAAVYAFDGVVDADTWALVDYATVYGADRIPTQGRTYWQVNGASIPGEIPAVGPAPTGNTASPWIMLNYSETKEGSVTFDKIEFMPRENSGLVKKYTVEISDNNNTWIKIIRTEDTQPFPASYSLVTHQLPQPITAKYIRWVCVEGNASANNTGLSHFALYNTAVCQ